MQISRAMYILITSLRDNLSLTNARKKVNDENGLLFDFSKANGDTANINKIYTKDDKNLTIFFEKIDIYTNNERNKKGELIYNAKLNFNQELNLTNIQILTTINNNIFNNNKSLYKVVLNKIKNDFEKINTTDYYNRGIVSCKKNTAGNYAIEYNNNVEILTYETFSFDDFFDSKFQLKKDWIEKIKIKIEKINCIELFLLYNSTIKEDILKEITKIINKKGIN